MKSVFGIYVAPSTFGDTS